MTSAEIVDTAGDGTLLLSTDSLTGRLGFVDISDPSSPSPAGVLELDGEPTSVAVLGRWALVPVNTSDDFTSPSGELAVVNVRTRHVVRTITLAGQPDSVAISPDGRDAAIVTENERDEDANDGLIPQEPPGASRCSSSSASPLAGPSRRSISPVLPTSPRTIPSPSTSTSTPRTRPSSASRRTTTS